MPLLIPNLSVSEKIQGNAISTRRPVRLATVTNHVLSDVVAGYVIDGHVINVNDRILFKNQLIEEDNGVYEVPEFTSVVRASDYGVGSKCDGVSIVITDGLENNDTIFLCSNPFDEAVVGVNELNFVKYTGSGFYIFASTPTIFDDIVKGYGVGNRWIDTNTDLEYICFDNTANNAVWRQISAPAAPITINNVGGGAEVYEEKTNTNLRTLVSATGDKVPVTQVGQTITFDVDESKLDDTKLPNYKKCNITNVPPTVNDDDTLGYEPCSRWIDTNLHNEFVMISNATGAARWKETTTLDTVQNITADATTILENALVVRLNFTAVGATVILPEISTLNSNKGYSKKYLIVKEFNDNSQIDIITSGSDKIDGTDTVFELHRQFDQVTVISNGDTQWYTV